MAALVDSMLVLFLVFFVAFAATIQDRKAYIVFMKGESSNETIHINLLNQVLEGCSPQESLIHSYKNIINGFAAKFTKNEMQKVKGMKEMVSLVIPNPEYTYQTSRSWDFLQFDDYVLRMPSAESDVIIGVIDTGIWPEHESFRDDGLGPPPSKWKGACHHGIKCNNKLIGARSYYRPNFTYGDCSPIDENGHGTHVASIAAGLNVYNAELFGLGKGTIRGAVPRARIAIYKICQMIHGLILEAIIDAVNDGVDILSISIAQNIHTLDYFYDPIAMGAFYAMKHGVLTSAAAGNEGPAMGTVRNAAPWLLSVAATSTDRRIVTNLALGDGSIIAGVSINTYDMETAPIVYLGDIGFYPPRSCNEAVDDGLFRDKILFCTGPYNTTVKLHGAKGVIILSARDDVPNLCDIPSIAVNYSSGNIIWDYIFVNDESAEATIFKSHAVFDDKAPTVASFSARGPGVISPRVLKPDISAPGVSILAAWPEEVPLTYNETDPQHRSRFSMVSGTSMACPHVSGVAAYVKSVHPTWSPAAIMSALMTTASPMDPSLVDEREFAYGAGMLNPVLAPFPGLVFDAGVDDYIFMLCRQGYHPELISRITDDETFSCQDLLGKIQDFNYPSEAIFLSKKNTFNGFKRTVTNVGIPNSVYTWTVQSDSGIEVSVEPKAGFNFTRLGEKQSFVALVSGNMSTERRVASAALILDDGVHRVRFPIVVYYFDI